MARRIFVPLIILCFIAAFIILAAFFALPFGENEASLEADMEQTPIQSGPAPLPSATQTPGPDTEHTPDPIKLRAQELLEQMNLREKICQMFIVYPTVLQGEADSMENALGAYPVGGLIFRRADLALLGDEGTKEFIAGVQSLAAIDLIIAADEEGGRVRRLMGTLSTTLLNSMFSYRDEGVERAYANAATIAGDMLRYGFNADLAPVADVWSNSGNTVIGDRAYSDDFAQAAELVAGAVRGFNDTGLICALKHFPGHGDTREDSHYTSAIVGKTLAELENEEFLPFIAGIEAGADMVMVGHLTVPEIDDIPATLSYKIVSGILRGQLGYKGVIISDGLEMAAVAGYPAGELEVLIVEAGIDVLLGSTGLTVPVEALEQAVQSGRISEERINESVLRILEMKLRNGVIE